MTKRAVFLDRDGTLIEHYDYITETNQVQLLATTVSALRLLREHNFLLIVATNQSAVARGMITEKRLNEIHEHLKNLLIEQGVYVDQIYYCPYHRQGTVEKYTRDSDLRKPNIGMLLQAAKDFGIDLSQSWMVGDDDRDIETGKNAACRTILLESHSGSPLVQRGNSAPDFRAVNLQEAANLIIHHADQPNDNSEGQKSSSQKDFSARSRTKEQVPKPSSERTEPLAQHDEAEAIAREVRDHEIARRKALKKSTMVVREPPGETEDYEADPLEKSRDALLAQILRELKSLNRHQSFTEFSVFKMFALIVQMIVGLCLILAFWSWSNPEPKWETVHSSLLLAVVFQMLALTLLIMHKNQ